jgi:hypothetical protein
MKKVVNHVIVFLISILSFSCMNNTDRKILVDEKALIIKLSKNNFYEKFFSYNIRPRDEGSIYMIEADSFKEFWVSYKGSKGVSYIDNVFIDNNLKSIYHDEYLEKKKSILSELNILIPFMIANGVAATVHAGKVRISFYLTNDVEIDRWHNQSTIKEGIEMLRKYYDNVVIVDNNWVISKNRKI